MVGRIKFKIRVIRYYWHLKGDGSWREAAQMLYQCIDSMHADPIDYKICSVLNKN